MKPDDGQGVKLCMRTAAELAASVGVTMLLCCA